MILGLLKKFNLAPDTEPITGRRKPLTLWFAMPAADRNQQLLEPRI
jgi:hypothetical protein